jgi:hypothetical protein
MVSQDFKQLWQVAGALFLYDGMEVGVSITPHFHPIPLGWVVYLPAAGG